MISLRNISFTCIALFLITACAALNPTLKNPDVKLVGLRMLPSQSLLQKTIAVDLKILNPNQQDLTIRGITYTIGIENINVLSGVTNQVPQLKGMAETPVTLEVSADMIQLVRLVEYFSQHGIGENVNYNFAAEIDFSAWLPSMYVNKKGAVPLGGNIR